MAKILGLVKGKTSEEQIASIDMILQALWKRGLNKIFGLLAPIPFHCNCTTPASDGVVCTMLIPLRCRISNAVIFFGRKEVSQLTLKVTLVNDGHESTTDVFITDQKTTFALNVDVMSGAMVTCKVSDPTKVGNILIGFLGFPEMKDYTQLTYAEDQLIPQVEKSIDSDQEEAIESTGSSAGTSNIRKEQPKKSAPKKKRASRK